MSGEDGRESEPWSVAGHPLGTPAEEQQGPPADERGPETPFEESAASWVPPWARAVPELVIEPAADDPPIDLSTRRQVSGPSPEPEKVAERSVEQSDSSTEPLGDLEEGPLPDPESYEPGMTDADLRAALEAIMLVVDEPVTGVVLAQVLEEPTSRVEATLQALAEEYAAAGRGFELRAVAGGWRMYTRGQYADYVERFVLDGQQVRLTQAALETLAVIAYKQPVTRSRVSAIRGVNCEGVIKTLVTRGLVEECGTEPDSGAHLYRTTPLFLEKLGLNSVLELPSLAPFLPDNVDEIDLAQR